MPSLEEGANRRGFSRVDKQFTGKQGLEACSKTNSKVGFGN